MFTEKNLLDFLDRFDRSKKEKLIKTFIKSLSSHKKLCKLALLKNDIIALQNSMHDIKSIACSIGDRKLGDLADRIEMNARSGLDKSAFTEAPHIFSYIQNILFVLEKNLESSIENG